jgi:Ricin-type beta-trefoil lectin domain
MARALLRRRAMSKSAIRLVPAIVVGFMGLHCGDAASTGGGGSTEQEISGAVFSGPIHPQASSSLCLDVVGQGTANGTAVQVWSCSGNANQQWTYDGTSLRVYGDKCLDVTGGNTTNGTKLQIWDCATGNANQMWTEAGATLQWTGKGKCLDLTNGVAANGTPIQSWSCSAGDTYQEWTFPGATVVADSGAPPTQPSAGVDYAPYFPTWVWGGSGYAFTGLVDLQRKAGLDEVTIAFVLSNGGCNTTQDIEQNMGDVNAFRAAGGHVKASFGGADGAYVESKCGSASALASAIESFVDATGITDLDFDVEQDPMETDSVNAMRGAALKMVQDAKGIKVAFTLPANPSPGGGLADEGKSVVSNAIAAGVTISHVNFMTMDYGDSFGGHPLAPVVVGTLDDGHTQLMSLVPGISSAAAWAMVGVIPMIGKNDDSEVFSLSDATTLAQFVTANHVGLASFWSIDRDQTGSDYNTASTVESTDFAFNTIFEAAFR